MSHLNERKERNCLNCNAVLLGKYCHICGQENVEPKETVWHLINHFIQDITHFDGKFFHTLRCLLWKPGYVSREYINGRRASYLNPVRMYVFTSAFFFLIFFTVFKTDENELISFSFKAKTLEQISKMDSATFADFTRNINREDKKPDVPMTREAFNRYTDSAQKSSGLTIFGRKYRTWAEYDSVLANGTVKDGWVKRLFVYKAIDLNKKYNSNPQEITAAFKTSLMHSLPQMLFISLPLLALLLKLLYVRQKQFYYVNHAIFSIHLYIFVFITILAILAISGIQDRLKWSGLNYLVGLLNIFIFFYDYKAMRNFYGQSRAKTVLKFFLLNIMFLFVITFLFVVFVLLSMFKI